MKGCQLNKQTISLTLLNFLYPFRLLSDHGPYFLYLVRDFIQLARLSSHCIVNVAFDHLKFTYCANTDANLQGPSQSEIRAESKVGRQLT